MIIANRFLFHKTELQEQGSLLRLFDYQELPQVDQIIILYFRLDDAHRSQFMDMGNYLAEKGTSQERLKKLKTLKK